MSDQHETRPEDLETITDDHVRGFVNNTRGVIQALEERILAKRALISRLQSDCERLEKVRDGYRLGLAKIQGDLS